ncbi:MAG: hypothetical protein ACRD03_09610 [Acidimicrobiales bacterium]
MAAASISNRSTSSPTRTSRRLAPSARSSTSRPIRSGRSFARPPASGCLGRAGNYASHSLRAGFVTDALDAGATREQVQRHGRWTNIRSIDPYYRKTEVWGRNNPSQRLAGS